MFNTEALITLGDRMKLGVPYNVLEQAIADNPIFTRDSIFFAINAITSNLLDRAKLTTWVGSYPNNDIKGLKIAIIMAGNIPLVGISDLISVISCNGVPFVKPSSKDKALMMWVIGILKEYGLKIELLDENTQPDAVIATGSDASNIIFKQKYGHLPLLVRGSRTSVAIIPEMLSEAAAQNLFVDMFQHSSLGCRNISHLLINSTLNMEEIITMLSHISLNSNYIKNNYRQKRAILEMTGASYIDCGCFLLRKSTSLGAAIGEITYSLYDTDREMNEFLEQNSDSIQCVTGDGHIPYGYAQKPTLQDWADGIDTIKFLTGTINRTR